MSRLAFRVIRLGSNSWDVPIAICPHVSMLGREDTPDTPQGTGFDSSEYSDIITVRCQTCGDIVFINLIN